VSPGRTGLGATAVLPQFGAKRLDAIKRDEIKVMISELIAKELSRNTIRNTLCVLRGMFNQAIEPGLLEANPAARLGRFIRTVKTAETKGTALTQFEVQAFLSAAKEVCEEYYPLFLTALRAGLRRGNSLRCDGAIFSSAQMKLTENRYILVQHNYVRREHTTTKSKKSRRVDLSRELRKVLIELRDKRLLTAFLEGNQDISDELVFQSPDGSISILIISTTGISCPSLRKQAFAKSGYTILDTRSDRY
jgi:integrase